MACSPVRDRHWRGPAVDFTGVVPPWARTTVKLSHMNGNNGWEPDIRGRLSGLFLSSNAGTKFQFFENTVVQA